MKDRPFLSELSSALCLALKKEGGEEGEKILVVKFDSFQLP